MYCWAVGRYGSRTAKLPDGRWAPVWIGKVYVAWQTRDDRWVWRLVRTFGEPTSGFSPSARFVGSLRTEREASWGPEKPGVVQWVPLTGEEARAAASEYLKSSMA